MRPSTQPRATTTISSRCTSEVRSRPGSRRLALESVGDADSNGIELSRVLGLIDYVNRTVLNHDETERTLRRLLGSGLAVETLDGFRRTTAGQDLHARCPSKFPLDRARWIESQPHGHGNQVVCDHRAVEEAM
jgi:hypothetical protein